MSQEAVAQVVGASQATVSRWEDAESPSTPSAVEIAELADFFGVDPGWILGEREHRTALPIGSALIDQAMLSSFERAKSPDELKQLLEAQMNFGTIWIQIPDGAQVVSVQEALQRVKEIDRHIRTVYPSLWQDWAQLVLR